MKNPTYEQALTKQGVAFNYHERIDLEDIDASKGLRNQARLVTPLEDELVESYAEAVRSGSEFPPVVLWRPGRGRWVPVDGNNRLAAYQKAGKSWTDAYTLDVTDAQVVDRVTWVFNNLVNGKRLSKDECVQHAVTFVRKYGMSQEQAAKEWGVPVYAVRRQVRASHLKEVLQSHNVKKMPDEATLERLGALEVAGEDVFVAAAQVIVASGSGLAGADELVKEVRAKKTQEQKMKAVDDFARSEFVRQKAAETKGGTIKPRSPAPRDRLKSLVHQAVLLCGNFPDKAALKPAAHEYKAVRAEAQQLCNKLISLFGLGALLNEEAG